MAEFGALRVTIEIGDEMPRSFRSLTSFIETLDDAGEPFLRELEIILDTSGGFVIDSVDRAAFGAGVLQALSALPDERYLKLVSAVASRFNGDITFTSHWPILRASSSLRTMADGEGESISLPGGAQ
jgi:hypothetical protein